MNVNRVILAGNLTRDPVLRYTPNQLAICDFGLAMHERWTDKQGDTQENTVFVEVSCFGERAEIVNKHFSKGKNIFIEGRLTFDSWDDKTTGAKRTKVAVKMERFEFIGKPTPSDRQGKDEIPDFGHE